MDTRPAAKPFPIPVVALGPGSQSEDEALDYLVMPQGMSTFQAPRLPEPEDMAGHTGAHAALRAALAALQGAARGEAPEPVRLDHLAGGDRELLNQVLGEGEVSAQVLDEHGRARVRVQESVFAGLWRVVDLGAGAGAQDALEAGALPAVLERAARQDGQAARPHVEAPAGVMNSPALIQELEDQRRRWRHGQPAHVINLTLLPLVPADAAHLDAVLGSGRVVILSRGYGNCRVSSTALPHTWRVVYYNSQDTVILNAIEVGGVPDVARAAREDLADSAERLAEVLAWVDQA